MKERLRYPVDENKMISDATKYTTIILVNQIMGKSGSHLRLFLCWKLGFGPFMISPTWIYTNAILTMIYPTWICAFHHWFFSPVCYIDEWAKLSSL